LSDICDSKARTSSITACQVYRDKLVVRTQREGFGD
jgi:hypothetical protein